MQLEYLAILLTILMTFLLSISYAIGRIKGKSDCINHNCGKCRYWNHSLGKDYSLCQSPESEKYFDCELRTSKKYGCIFFRRRKRLDYEDRY